MKKNNQQVLLRIAVSLLTIIVVAFFMYLYITTRAVTLTADFDSASSTSSREVQGSSKYQQGSMRIRGNELTVDIANTQQMRAQGLAGVVGLSDSYGMVFVFDQATTHAFWMKGMLEPIDIIWIRDGRIIGTHTHVQPELGVADVDLAQYQSPGVVDLVLEVRAGLFEESGWQVGDQVVFSL